MTKRNTIIASGTAAVAAIVLAATAIAGPVCWNGNSIQSPMWGTSGTCPLPAPTK